MIPCSAGTGRTKCPPATGMTCCPEGTDRPDGRWGGQHTFIGGIGNDTAVAARHRSVAGIGDLN